MSTAYVNCNLRGDIEEKIYPLETGEDYETVVKRITSLSREQAAEQESKIIGNFPNTYTFTKNLAEKNLERKRGNVKVVIVRPAVVASSKSSPVPGWTDALTAAASPTLLWALGLYGHLPSDGEHPVDVIPADIVINSCLLAIVASALEQTPFKVYNCGSTAINPLTTKNFIELLRPVVEGLETKPKDAVFTPNLKLYGNQTEYSIKKYLSNDLPMKALEKVSKAPLIGSKKLRKMHETLAKTLKFRDKIADQLEFFFCNAWVYHAQGVIDLYERTRGEERELFDCDIRTIDWEKYLHDFMYGVHVYAMKEANIAPKYQMKKLMPSLRANNPLQIVKSDVIKVGSKSTQDYESSILVKERFDKYFTRRAPLGNQIGKGSIGVRSPKFEHRKKEIQRELERIRCHFDPKSTKALFLLCAKIVGHLMTSVFCDQVGLNRVKSLLASSRKARVILVPQFKSWGDPLVMHYLSCLSDLELGFTFGCYEDSPKAAMIESLLKRSGHILLKRDISDKKNPDGGYIAESLLQEVIKSNSITTII